MSRTLYSMRYVRLLSHLCIPNCNNIHHIYAFLKLTTYITANKLFRLPIVNAVIINFDVYLFYRRYVITFKSNSTPLVLNKIAT